MGPTRSTSHGGQIWLRSARQGIDCAALGERNHAPLRANSVFAERTVDVSAKSRCRPRVLGGVFSTAAGPTHSVGAETGSTLK